MEAKIMYLEEEIRKLNNEIESLKEELENAKSVYNRKTEEGYRKSGEIKAYRDIIDTLLSKD